MFTLSVIQINLEICNLNADYQSSLVILLINKERQYDLIIFKEILQLIQAIFQSCLVVKLSTKVSIKVKNLNRGIIGGGLRIQVYWITHSGSLKVVLRLTNEVYFLQDFKVNIDNVFSEKFTLRKFKQVFFVDYSIIIFKDLSNMVWVAIVVREFKFILILNCL